LAGIVNAGEHVGDPTRTAVLQDRLDHRSVFTRELARARRWHGLVDRVDVHVERAVGTDLAGADASAADAANHQRAGSVGEIAGALDRGDGADRA
jgi:hypothetical protein